MITPEYISVSPDLLRKNPWNTNKVSADNEEKIRNSIKRNGIFKPIIVRTVEGINGYEIIGGEHRWEQAIELGYTNVPVVNLGLISEKAAKEIGIVDNARYGSDDAVGLGDLLKEIGNIDEIQTFLPYGDTDLNVLFSANDVDLDDLGGDYDDDVAAPEMEDPTEVTKPVKTHQVARFKISLSDAERLTALIAATQRTHGYTEADDLTNAGDALVHLLSPHFLAKTEPVAEPDGYGEEVNILDDLILAEAN